MKILNVILTLTPQYGGPVTMLKDISLALKQRGHTITIVATNFAYPHGKVAREAFSDFGGAEVYLFPFCSENFAFSFQLAKFVWTRVRDYDVVHIHCLYRFPTSFAAFAAWLKNIPYVVSIHGALDPFLYVRRRNRLLKRLYERCIDFPLLRRAAKIHYATAEESTLVQRLELGDKVIIPNGVDRKRFVPLPPKGAFRAKLGIGDEPILLFVGRINFKKGLDLMIKSMNVIIESLPTAKLIIAGPDNEGYLDSLKEIVSLLGIEQNVIFLDMLSNSQMAEAFVDATIFVLPSYSENFGIAVVEAMLCGCPVLISDRVNIHHDLSKHNAGVVVKCNVHDVAQNAIKMIEDQGLRQTLSHNGARVVNSFYTIDSVARQFDGLYHEIACSDKAQTGSSP